MFCHSSATCSQTDDAQPTTTIMRTAGRAEPGWPGFPGLLKTESSYCMIRSAPVWSFPIWQLAVSATARPGSHRALTRPPRAHSAMRLVLLLAVLGGAASLPLTGPESAMLERVADDVAELERMARTVDKYRELSATQKVMLQLKGAEKVLGFRPFGKKSADGIARALRARASELKVALSRGVASGGGE